MSDEKPWEDYADPIAAPTVTATASLGPAGPSTTEDVIKGAAGGLGRGVASTVGGAGSVGGLVHAGLSKLGVPEDYINTGAEIVRRSGTPLRAFTGPDTAQVQKAIEGYTGPFYQPKTVPGQYASTLGEFAPAAAIPGGGGVGARILNTVVPAVASETAGQLTKDTAAEPYARGAAALVSGPAAAKLITPAAAPSAARAAMTATLDREGIPLTAGQRTGSPMVQYAESNAANMPLSSGRAAEMGAQQASAYDRAVTRQLYDPAQLTARGVPADVSLPDPRAVNAGRQSLSDEYDRVLGGNTFNSDPQLHTDIFRARDRYNANVLPSARAGGARDLEDIHNELIDKLVAGQGTMPGTEYQALRSRYGKLAEGARNSDPYLAEGLTGVRNALDQAMARGLPPRDAAALALNNQRWGRMRQTEGAVARGGENLSPLAVAQTARAGRPGQYAAQTSDLDRLAKAASVVMKPLPNSGTAQRLGWQSMFNLPAILASSGGGVAGSLVGGPVGGILGAAAPSLLSRAIVSRPGQAYLANQVLPQNPRDIIAQIMAQQAITQPGIVDRNTQAQADYERQRKQQRVQQGLPE